MKWRCYAWAGGVEESKFCLFSVVYHVRCISSVSPRFYFRRHTFCFLPLASILELPLLFFPLANSYLTFSDVTSSGKSSLKCHPSPKFTAMVRSKPLLAATWLTEKVLQSKILQDTILFHTYPV
jgi:hypothetical protein